jgi:hypothetical protein
MRKGMRRSGKGILVWGVCVVLLPACTPRGRLPLEAPQSPAIEVSPQPTAATAQAVSPYHPIVTFPPSDAERVVEPAAVPSLPLQPESPPPALPAMLPVPGQIAPAGSEANWPLSAPVLGSVQADPPLLAALRCFLDRRPENALACLQDLHRANQEVLLHLLPLAVRLGERGLDEVEAEEVAVEIEQLENVIALLRPRAALQLDQMCFCRRIDRYGVYEPLPAGYRFRPGELVQLYAEVRNFASTPQEGAHVTRLASRLEIHDYEGHIVWCRDFPEDRQRPDVSRTPRHDYFNQYRFCVPEIPAGAYTLWLYVTDKGCQPQRVARRSLDFRVSNLARP